MKKYWTVFNISWQNGFVYRLDFLLWRVRSVIIILTVYFLWDAIFQNGGILFGYSREKILTYVFLTLIVRSLVLGLRSIDAAGEIADGRLSNYLLKPISYHVYWFVRDLADKFLNIVFSCLEVGVLYFFLRPPIYLQTDAAVWLIFGVMLILALILNFLLGTLSSYFAFWIPGQSWGFWFIYLIFQDFLGGVMFPLDILPKAIYNLVTLLPFPYLLYFPANVYLGKFDNPELIKGIIVIIFWVLALNLLLKKEWKLGLKTFQSEGR